MLVIMGNYFFLVFDLLLGIICVILFSYIEKKLFLGFLKLVIWINIWEFGRN